MNGPQRTAVFRKEFLSYSFFGYERNIPLSSLTWSGIHAMTMRCRTRHGRTEGRTHN